MLVRSTFFAFRGEAVTKEFKEKPVRRVPHNPLTSKIGLISSLPNFPTINCIISSLEFYSSEEVVVVSRCLTGMIAPDRLLKRGSWFIAGSCFCPMFQIIQVQVHIRLMNGSFSFIQHQHIDTQNSLDVRDTSSGSDTSIPTVHNRSGIVSKRHRRASEVANDSHLFRHCQFLASLGALFSSARISVCSSISISHGRWTLLSHYEAAPISTSQHMPLPTPMTPWFHSLKERTSTENR
eukprot:scaffold8637_cov153-Skeletonema_dohrnii-CCMP3373.AAC.18